MKYLYRSFALGLIVFSSFAFAAEEDVISVPEKPISEAELIDTSFVKEEIVVKDEYYDNLEDNIFDNTEIKIKDDVNEGTIYTLGEIKRSLIDDEFTEAKPEIIDGGEFMETKPEPPFIEDAEALTPPPVIMTLGGEIAENNWVYMTANMSPSANHHPMAHNMSGHGNICVSEPFAVVALLSACVAFMSVRRRKEA